MIHEPWCLSLVTFPCVLEPGCWIDDPSPPAGGKRLVLVYEVSFFASRSTLVAGRRRRLFAVLHAGGGSAVVGIAMDPKQKAWRLTPRQIAAYKRRGAPVVCLTDGAARR